MRARHKLGVIAAATAALLAGGGVMASAASAVQKCQDTGNGLLCIEHFKLKGYDATYVKRSGSTVQADFNLVCGRQRFGDEGAFWISAGARNTYFFSVGDQGPCRIEMYDYSTGQWISSPSSHG